MHRTLLLVPMVLFGCSTQTGIIDVSGDDVGTDPDITTPDYSEYDNATLRIVAPVSGGFLPLEEPPHTFEAELLDANGAPLAFDEVRWTSSLDAGWAGTGMTFEDDALNVGTHDITAQVSLPNGDRLAYTAGGVLLQSIYAGTYAGLFNVNLTGDYQGTPITVSCSGSTVLVVDAWGEAATGASECLLTIPVVNITLPANFTFDLANDQGTLEGTANADLGFFDVPFEATGSLDPESHTLLLAWTGDLAGFGTMDGSVDTVRISLDSTLPQ